MKPGSLLIDGYLAGGYVAELGVSPYKFVIFIGAVKDIFTGTPRYMYLLRDGTIKTLCDDLTCYGWHEIV
jgi:hypothetical protein